jgi:uncharacterized protein
MRLTAATLALSASLLAGCTEGTERRSGFGPTVRLCQGGECRDVPRETTTLAAQTQDEQRRTRQSDPDAYRGEDPTALRAGVEAGDSRAAYLLGQVQEFGLAGQPRNPSAAMRSYGIAADAGMPWAQFRLAHLLRGTGQGSAQATRLTLAAAEAGHAEAAYNLAMDYRQGRGVPRNASESARWMQRAAENGVPEAQYALGVMMLNGEGMPRDLFGGLQFLRAAADGGNRAAQKTLGRIYMTGLDTMGQDLTQARSFLTPVAASGDAQARRWLAEVERAEREERDFQRQLELQAEQTRGLIAAAVLTALLTPPPVVIVSRW